jgi:alanyl aminopeptidase
VFTAALVALLAGCPAAKRGRATDPTPPAPAGPPLLTEPGPDGRLSDAVVPRRAALALSIDPASADYEGQVTYDVDLRGAVSAVWLHARGLAIASAEVVVGKRRVALRQVARAGQPDLLGLAVDGAAIGPGAAQVRLEFRGSMGDKLGLFRQRDGRDWYAFTDFEPSDARSAFPCFDEPRWKIPWRVSLLVPADLGAFGNARTAREQGVGHERKRVELAETRPLPSYLVAIAVGPFDVVDAGATPTPVRLLLQRGARTRAPIAVEAAPRMLALLEGYMGGASPYDKVDLVSVPHLNGAMENPGLITVHRTILEVERGPARTPLHEERRRLLLGVLAHELAHLWFGDLVTMADWPELWLNEGLATWLSDWVVSRYEPAIADEVLEIADAAPAAQLDREPAPRSVRAPVGAAADLDDVFGTMTYRKGGAVVSTFHALLGEERMRRALRRYAAAHADGVVTAPDLAAALTDAAGRELEPALTSLIDQPGIALVEAELTCREGAAAVTLRQTRWAPVGRPRAAGTWRLPVCVGFAGGAGPACTVMDGERARLELPVRGCPAWIHPNPRGDGYYDWSLPPAQLAALVARADLDQRDQIDIAESVDAAVRAGTLPLGAGLDALVALGRRGDPEVIRRTVALWELVVASVIEPAKRRALAAALAVYAPLARAVGVEMSGGDDSATRDLLRHLVPLVGRAGGDATLQTAAFTWLDAWLRDVPKTRTPTRFELPGLYLLAPLQGGAALYDALLRTSRGQVSVALGGFQQPALVKRALAGIRDGGARAPPPAAIELLAAFIGDPQAQALALPVALDLYPALAARLADTDRPVSAAIFAGVCRAEPRPAVLAALRATFGDTLPPAADEVLRAIDDCIAFRAHHLAAAAAYFKP